jgi:hypothetical protein
VIKGFLFHQGESDNGSSTWIPRLRGVLDSLKKDLGLDNTLPIIVGELRQDARACCASHNRLVDSMPKIYPACGVASSAGLTVQSDDPYHFDAAGMRELGRRYALAFLALASDAYIPRKGSTNTIHERPAIYRAVKSATSSIRVYSLNGRAIRFYPAADAPKAFRDLKAGGVYIVSRRLNDGRTVVLPFVKE